MHPIRFRAMKCRGVFSIAALATICSATLWAQDASDILRNTPVLTNQCHGPLGSLLPECQSGKTAITIAPPSQPGAGASAAPNVRIDSAKEAAAAPYAGAVLNPTAPPTEFQRFVADPIGGNLQHVLEERDAPADYRGDVPGLA